LPTLQPNTTYYWQVRAWNNTSGPTYADGASTAFWAFVTKPIPPNPLQNGGFELGDVSWAEYSLLGYDLILNAAEGLTVPAHNGLWAAWLGGDDDEISSISQTVTIPSGRSILHYWFASGSQDYCQFDDYFRVYVGSTQVYIQKLCDENSTGGWIPRTLDLTAYAGTTQTIKFQVNTDWVLNSNVFLDDISFETSTSLSSIFVKFPSDQPFTTRKSLGE
jgi:hypothetical protein